MGNMVNETSEMSFEYVFFVDEDAGEECVVITKGRGVRGDLVIPSEIDGCRVVGIGEAAFMDCIELT